ncbi:MAG: hypothetical protein ACK55O_09465 [Phycisphaerales bacterium]
MIGSVMVVAAFVAFSVLSISGVFDYDVWKREKPLASPIAVTSVRDGAITLSDGRVFRPAGVQRPEGVAAEDYDNAVRVIVAQGVIVVRDLGDGSAFLLAEPKFYNWCGTRNADGIPWKRWAGSYLQCPVSELLVQTAYAIPALDQDQLTARERWRLEGVEHIAGIAESPTRISNDLGAFRYGGGESYLSDYDETLELMWKLAPSQ